MKIGLGASVNAYAARRFATGEPVHRGAKDAANTLRVLFSSDWEALCSGGQ